MLVSLHNRPSGPIPTIGECFNDKAKHLRDFIKAIIQSLSAFICIFQALCSKHFPQKLLETFVFWSGKCNK